MPILSSLTIFFPAYNEQDNIRKTLEAALAIGSSVTRQLEILVVDDASGDNTASTVLQLAEDHPEVRLIKHMRNQGYGQAVKTGLQAATGEYVFFADADLQFDLQELAYLVPHAENYDVVIGYRANRQDSWLRLVNAKGWSILNRIFFDLHVKDIDCAFKLLRREVVQAVPLVSSGAMLSAELLIRLRQQGLSFKEIPVTHYPRVSGIATGARPSVIVKALQEMTQLFFTDLGRPIRQQLWRYAFIGAINTGVDLTGYFFLAPVLASVSSLGEVVAKALSFLAGTFTSFTLNRSFTFPSDGYRSRGWWPYVSVSLVGLLVNTGVFALARSVGLDQLLAVALATLASFGVGFSLVKMYIFQPLTKV
jgi:glycosyltransferase involved in cell wall biosynthesis